MITGYQYAVPALAVNEFLFPQQSRCRYARQGMGGRSPIPTAEYPAGFFFYDSEASWSTDWRLVLLVSDGSSRPSLLSRLSLPLNEPDDARRTVASA